MYSSSSTVSCLTLCPSVFLSSLFHQGKIVFQHVKFFVAGSSLPPSVRHESSGSN